MPVNTTHPQYDEYKAKWRRCRVLTKGEMDVHEAGAEFLPRLEGQENEDYESYKTRALFFNAAGRTRKALIGAVFHKQPHLEPKDSDFFDNISQQGEDFETHSRWALRQVLTTGRMALLLDLPEGETIGTPQPFIAAYQAEDVINWRKAVIDGQEVPTVIVFRETETEEDPDDPFELTELTVYREVGLTRSGDGKTAIYGAYYQQMWEQEKAEDGSRSDKYVKRGAPIIPKVSGQEIDRIPVRIVGVDSNKLEPDEPPLLDLITINLSHYRNSADLEHGRHYTGLPTPWVAGFDESKTKLKIGSQYAWVTNKTDAKCGFLEFTGQGLKSLENAMDEKVQLMAILGARALEVARNTVEAVETHQIRNRSEHSVLSIIANNLSEAYTDLLKIRAEWMKVPGKISVALNTDYSVMITTPQMLAEWRNYLMGGLISYETLFYNMRRAELIPLDRTAEEERDVIDAEGGLTQQLADDIATASTPPPQPAVTSTPSGPSNIQ